MHKIVTQSRRERNENRKNKWMTKGLAMSKSTKK